MKKKVDTHELKPGMYVSGLDRPWRETPFLFQGFYIHSHADIEQIKDYCQYVFIDLNLDRTGTRSPVPDDQKVELEILKKNAQPRQRAGAGAGYEDVTSIEEEIEAARETYHECKESIHSIMDDARLGRSLDTEGARKTVGTLAQSIVRNPDALMCLTQLKQKDEYTVQHSLRVCILGLAFGRHLGLSEVELRELGLGALLHDVGKAKVPEEILNKPSALTEKEYAIIKQHVPAGVKILMGCANLSATALEIASQHHERYDGRGYSFGLAAEQIGRAGTIAGIVDCYDALTSDRPYRSAISAHNALKKMYTWRDSHFESLSVEQFIQCIGIYPIGSLVELTTGHVGVVLSQNRRRSLRPKVILVLNRERKRYTTPVVVDLMEQMRDEAGTQWEIRAVLEPGSFGINATNYLPLPVS